MNKLINCDCIAAMKEIDSESINLYMTSPPYAKQRSYNGASADEYIDFISPIVREVVRTLKNDGSFVINIKEHCLNGQRHLYVYKMVIHFVEVLGLRLVDEFVWNKTNPFPSGAKNRLKDGFERVFHFTKTGKYKFYPEKVLIKSTSKWLEGEKRRKNKGGHNVTNGSGMNMGKRICSDMVRPSNVIVGSTSNINIGHPAVFPEYLPEFFYQAIDRAR